MRRRVAVFGEAERAAVLVEEIFLLKAEPCAGVVENGCAAVARMRRLAVRHHDFAHDDHAVDARGVGINSHRFKHAIRRAAFGLARRAAVKAPHREFFQFREALEFLDLCFAAEVGDGFVSVEPEVF